jgi:hypothetical protein
MNEYFTKEKINNLLKSLQLNYKSFLLLFIALIFLSKNNYLICFITFFILLILSYLSHYFYHCEIFYPLNVVHIYHHENNNIFSHFIQVILEFQTACFMLCIHYLFNFPLLFNEWILLFFYLFYTTIHNINYSFFHVNHVHEIHHKKMNKNFGPDICDIMFSTKYNIKKDIENTDHYIVNIIILFFLIICLKKFCEKDENKKLFRICFISIYLFFSIVLLITTIYFFRKNPNNINQKYYKLIYKIKKIIMSQDSKKWKKLYQIIIQKNNYLTNKKKKNKDNEKRVKSK